MLQTGRFMLADKHKHENRNGRIGDWVHEHSSFITKYCRMTYLELTIPKIK